MRPVLARALGTRYIATWKVEAAVGPLAVKSTDGAALGFSGQILLTEEARAQSLSRAAAWIKLLFKLSLLCHADSKEATLLQMGCL